MKFGRDVDEIFFFFFFFFFNKNSLTLSVSSNYFNFTSKLDFMMFNKIQLANEAEINRRNVQLKLVYLLLYYTG